MKAKNYIFDNKETHLNCAIDEITSVIFSNSQIHNVGLSGWDDRDIISNTNFEENENTINLINLILDKVLYTEMILGTDRTIELFNEKNNQILKEEDLDYFFNRVDKAISNEFDIKTMLINDNGDLLFISETDEGISIKTTNKNLEGEKVEILENAIRFGDTFKLKGMELTAEKGIFNIIEIYCYSDGVAIFEKEKNKEEKPALTNKQKNKL